MEEKVERVGVLEWEGRYLIMKEFSGSMIIETKEEFEEFKKDKRYRIKGYTQ